MTASFSFNGTDLSAYGLHCGYPKITKAQEIAYARLPRKAAKLDVSVPPVEISLDCDVTAASHSALVTALDSIRAVLENDTECNLAVDIISGRYWKAYFKNMTHVSENAVNWTGTIVFLALDPPPYSSTEIDLETVIIINSSFEGADPTAEWSAVRAVLSDETSIVYDGGHSLKIVTDDAGGAGAARAQYTILNYAYYAGKTITIGMMCRAPSTNDKEQVLAVYDGVGSTSSAVIPNDDEFHWITVTHEVDESATVLQLWSVSKSSAAADTDDTLYIDNVKVAIGASFPSQIVTTSPFLTLNVGGTSEIEPVYTLIAGDEMTDITIILTNSTTGETLTREGSFADEDELEIDVVNKVVKLNGDADDGMAGLDPTSDFPRLEGNTANSIIVTGITTGSLKIKYRNRY